MAEVAGAAKLKLLGQIFDNYQGLVEKGMA